MSATVSGDDDVTLTSLPVESPSARKSVATESWLAGDDQNDALTLRGGGVEPS